LESLDAGHNRITTLSHLKCRALTTLHAPHNALAALGVVDTAGIPATEEAVLSHNAIATVEGLAALTKLQVRMRACVRDGAR